MWPLQFRPPNVKSDFQIRYILLYLGFQFNSANSHCSFKDLHKKRSRSKLLRIQILSIDLSPNAAIYKHKNKCFPLQQLEHRFTPHCLNSHSNYRERPEFAWWWSPQNAIAYGRLATAHITIRTWPQILATWKIVMRILACSLQTLHRDATIWKSTLNSELRIYIAKFALLTFIDAQLYWPLLWNGQLLNGNKQSRTYSLDSAT
jgi:hypothetical protein